MKERLEKIRTHYDLTKKEFANKIGISPTAYNNYINENRIPTTDVIFKLHMLFNINLNWLMSEQGNMLIDQDSDKKDLVNEFKKLTKLQQEYYYYLIQADLIKNKINEQS